MTNHSSLTKEEKYAMVTVFPAWDGAHPVVPNVLTNPLSPASCSTSVASLTDTATLRTAQSARASLTLRRPRLCNKIATWHPYFRTTPSRLSVINWENGFWRPKWHLRGWSLYCFANYILRQFSNDFYSIWHSSQLWAPLWVHAQVLTLSHSLSAMITMIVKIIAAVALQPARYLLSWEWSWTH